MNHRNDSPSISWDIILVILVLGIAIGLCGPLTSCYPLEPRLECNPEFDTCLADGSIRQPDNPLEVIIHIAE